jgi:acyl homoserine lactone synthase
MVRIYRHMGWTPEVLGEEGHGRERIAVGLWQIDTAARDRLAAKAGLSPELSQLWYDRAFRYAPQEDAMVA